LALFGVLLDSALGFATLRFDADSIVAGGDDRVFLASRDEEPAGQGTDSGYFGSWLAPS
jgi:hypothetical protein